MDHRKRGAQNFVAANDFTDTPLQRLHVQRAINSQGSKFVVERRTTFQLDQKPQALLGEGKRERPSRETGCKAGTEADVSIVAFRQKSRISALRSRISPRTAGGRFPLGAR